MIATDDDRKRWQTVLAQTILAGFGAALIESDDGRPLLIVSRSALCKSFAAIDEAERWVLHANGTAAR